MAQSSDDMVSDMIKPKTTKPSTKATVQTVSVTVVNDVDGDVTVTHKQVPVTEKDAMLENLNVSGAVADCDDLEIIVRQGKRSRKLSKLLRESKEQSRASLGLWAHNHKDDGVLVSGVGTGTNAEAAGLQEGDLIVGINDDSIHDFESLADALSQYKPGEAVTVYYVRDSVEYSVEVELESHKLAKFHSLMWPGEGLADTSRDKDGKSLTSAVPTN